MREHALTNCAQIFLFVLFATVQCSGQESAVRFERRQVEATQLPSLIRAGNLVPIRREEFERRLKNADAKNGPGNEVVADRILYEATFGNGELTGTFRAEFPELPNKKESWAFLGPVVLQSLEVSGSDDWGSDESGNIIARVSDSRELRGTWKLAGSTQAWGTELVFPPLTALSNELRLRLPKTLSMESDNAIVQPGDSNGTERQYRIILNDQVASRLRILSSFPDQKRPVAEIRTTWTVSRDTAQVQTAFSLPATSPVTAVSIAIPPRVTVQSVTYADNQAIPIEIVETPNGRRVQIKMPTAIRSASRPLTLSGRLDAGIPDSWKIPSFDRITCTHPDGSKSTAVASRVSHRVIIESPLELQELQLDGFRQTESIFQTDVAQTVSLERIFESGQAVLRVGQARRTRQFQIATRIDFEARVWKQRTWIHANAPLPDRLDLIAPKGLTILAINTGSERTPCDFRLEPNTEGKIQVFLPPTVSSTLEIVAQSETTPRRTIAPVEGNVLTYTSIAPSGLVADRSSTPTTTQAAQIRDAFGPIIDNSFLRRDDVIVQTADDRLINLTRPTDRPTTTQQPELKETRPETSAAPIASLSLKSLVRQRPAPDWHTATLETTAKGTLSFSLPQRAKILNVTVNDIACRFQRDGDKFIVALDPSTTRNSVSIRYESSVAPEVSGLSAKRPVPIPNFSNTGDFTWSVETETPLQLTSNSLFGSIEEHDPLKHLLGPFAAQDTHTRLKDIRLPYVPDQLSVTTTSITLAGRLAWLSLMTTALLGLLLAAYRQIVWLSIFAAMMVVLSLSDTGSMGNICGAAALGLLSALAVANLVPRPNKTRNNEGSRGSTSLAPTVSAGLLVLLCLSTMNRAYAQTTQREPVVYEVADRETLYADKSVLDQLDKRIRSTPANLLHRDARYVVRFDGGTLSIKVSIQAIVRNPARSTSASFPFADANVSRCRINGKPTDFSRDGERINITIPADKDSGDEPQSVTLEFDLYPPSNGNGTRIRTAVAARSTCRIESDDDIRPNLNGTEVPPNTDVALTGDIDISTHATTTEVQTQATSFDTSCVVELAPVETVIEYQVAATPGRKAIEEISFKLPPTQRFISMTSPVASRQTVISGRSATYVHVIFDEPVIAPIDLRLRASHTSESAVPAQSLRLQPIVAGPTAVTVSAGANLQLSSLTWQPDGATEPGVRGITDGQSTRFNIRGAGAMQFQLDTAKAFRKLRLNQQVRIRADRLDYELDAEVEVTNGPVFAHRLVVSRELQIETVSVRENGVDRMARYQRAGDQLLLLLEGRTSGTQNIVIEGHVPAKLGAVTPIPGVVVEDARFRQSTLTLSRDSDLNVELLDTNGIPFAVRPDAALTGSIESGEATFELLESSQLPSIRTQRSSPMSIVAVCLMNLADGKPSGWTWQYRIENSAEDQIVFDKKGGELRSTSRRSEGKLTTLFPEPDDGETVTFSIIYDTPSETIPEPTFDSAIPMRRQLAIPTEPQFVVTTTNGEEPLDLVVDRTTETLRFYDFPKNATGIRVLQNQTNNETPRVQHMETTLWDLGDKVAGKTVIPLPEESAELRIHIPRGIKITSSDIDGRVAPARIEDQHLIFPSTAGKRITVSWKLNIEDAKRFDVPSPDLVDGEALFVFVPRTNNIELQSANLIPITGEQYAETRQFDGPVPAANSIMMLARVTDASTVGQDLQLTTIDTRSPMIGVALIAGATTLLICLGAGQIRTRNRILVLSGIMAILAVSIAGPSIIAALFLAPGLLCWWLIPQRM